jgi:hypothetical protein
MASVFRRGKRWYARFKNANGGWTKEAGFTDKTASLQLAVKREQEAELIRKVLAEPRQFSSDRLVEEDLKAFGKALANITCERSSNSHVGCRDIND